ncbi:hypothetical protein [Foetidibacter luteolus]|uniref:hypothetical protein n=1 Tax=Foetidibacter luteolus TaxID=2608880 RepID=UPI00129B57E0|nr:hypothetical protein [Foetidibacter luteolus]
MYIESRKIHLIEEVLKVEDESTLNALESVLKKAKKTRGKKNGIYDFVGVVTKKEAAQMRKAIEDTCETINENDWK